MSATPDSNATAATATALQDGRVFVTGGNANTTLLASSEIYNPRSDKWTEAAPMPRARTQHSAVTLFDGRVLVSGGIDADGAPTNTTFIYDPGTDTWTDGPPMTVARFQQVALLSPMSSYVRAYQDLFYYGEIPALPVWIVATVYAAGTFVCGLSVFLAYEDRFSEYL